MQMENTKLNLYGQQLAWQITIKHLMDPVDRVEPVETMKPDKFQETIVIQAKKDAIKEARKYQSGLVMQTDRSKLD